MSRALQLQAENVKRVEVIDITPAGDLVEIAGKNKQGKSSAVQCISMAIEGAKHIQRVPIREGAEEGRITVTLGTKGKDGEPDKVDLVVHREFSRREPTKSDDKPYATKLTLTLGDGQQPRQAQTILDGLYNSICTDPLAFTRMKPNEQYDRLRGMVPGFKFEEHDNLQRAARAQRTDINRDAERAKASASLISVPTGTPDDLVDEQAITNAMAEAGTKNGEIEGRRVRREQVAQQAVDLRKSAHFTRQRIPKVKQDIEEEIGELQRRIDGLRTKIAEQADVLEAAAAADDTAATDLETKLAAAEALPAPVDTDKLRADLAAAQASNKAVRDKLQKKRLLEDAATLEAESKALTERMAAREEAKNKAIAAAKLPVEGLAFGEGEILLNGLPFEQASFREQLVASCAVAMSSNPSIRVMYVADGNALDDDGWDVLRKIAAENDFQIFVESVKPQTDTAIVLENGRVKGK